jgi:hypothetical protein
VVVYSASGTVSALSFPSDVNSCDAEHSPRLLARSESRNSGQKTYIAEQTLKL